MRWENEMAQNEQNRNAASTLQAAIKRTLPAPIFLKEHYKKQYRATQKFQKLTQELGDTVQYGNIQGLLNEHEAYKQNISNLGRLSKVQMTI